MDWRKPAYSKYYDDYLVFARGNQSVAATRKQFTVWDKYYGRFLPKDKRVKIVDIGCGGGEIVFWLRERGYENVIGVEADRNQVESAKKFNLSNIELGDFREFLRNRKNYFDCIMARDVIEHFDKTEIFEVLDILYAALKGGGTMIIQTPNAASFLGNYYRYYDFTHCLCFSRTSLHHVLKTAGFSEVVFCPVRPVVHGLKSFVRHFFWRFIELVQAVYLLIATGSGREIFTLNIIAVVRK